MATTFIMLTRLAHGALRSPEALEKLEQEVKARIDQEVGKGGIEWLANSMPFSDRTTISTSSARRTWKRR